MTTSNGKSRIRKAEATQQTTSVLTERALQVSGALAFREKREKEGYTARAAKRGHAAGSKQGLIELISTSAEKDEIFR